MKKKGPAKGSHYKDPSELRVSHTTRLLKNTLKFYKANGEWLGIAPASLSAGVLDDFAGGKVPAKIKRVLDFLSDLKKEQHDLE